MSNLNTIEFNVNLPVYFKPYIGDIQDYFSSNHAFDLQDNDMIKYDVSSYITKTYINDINTQIDCINSFGGIIPAVENINKLNLIDKEEYFKGLVWYIIYNSMEVTTNDENLKHIQKKARKPRKPRVKKDINENNITIE